MYALYNPQTLQLIRTVQSGRRLRAPIGTTFEDASAVDVATLRQHGVYPVTDPGQPDLTGKRLIGTSVPAELETADDAVVLAYQTEDLTAEELAAELVQAKSTARDTLVDASEAARQAWMTRGDVKSAVYREKQREAETWLAAVAAGQTPDPADYPFLKGRAERLNPEEPDYLAVANEWNTLANGWKPVGAAIEDIYEGAVEAVAAATTVQQVAAIMATITWPVPE